MKRMICIIILLITCVDLSGCIKPYAASESFRKIDATAARVKFLQEAPDKEHVLKQKIKGIPDSFKLEGGLEALKDLEIVKDAEINNNKIKVDFLAKKMNSKIKFNTNEEKEITLEQIIFENALFLVYTIVDTFPDVNRIRLSADYYYLNEYGDPNKEAVFIANVKRIRIDKIDRNYFRPDMLQNILDYYLSEVITEESNLD